MEKSFPTHIVAADIIAENDKGEILLVYDPRRGWTWPGGIVENGENPIDAAKREALEESGAEVEIDRLICVSSNTSTYMGYGGYGMVPEKVILTFAGRYLGGELRGSDETTKAMFAPKEKLLEYVTAPAYVCRLRKFFDPGGGVIFAEYKTKPEFSLVLERDI